MSGQTHDSTPIWQQLHCPVGSSRPIPTYLLPTLSGSNTSGDERLLSPCKTCMAFRITIIMGMQLCRDEHVGPQAPTRAALDENQYQVAAQRPRPGCPTWVGRVLGWGTCRWGSWWLAGNWSELRSDACGAIIQVCYDVLMLNLHQMVDGCDVHGCMSLKCPIPLVGKDFRWGT